MKNVIVTGANGFSGSSLIKKLVDKEVNVETNVPIEDAYHLDFILTMNFEEIE